VSHLPEIAALLFGRAKPAMVTVNLTDRCNQHCIYCELGNEPASSKKKTLATADLEWIIDQMAEINIRKISLCGGEPFLFEGLTDVVAYADKKGVRCSITTNGMTVHALDEQKLNTLKECKTLINLSIDSFRDEIQSLTRGTPAALPNAMKSLKTLQDHGIAVTVLTAISKYNYHDLSHFLEEACGKGIRQVLFQPLIYYSNYPERRALENKAQLNAGAGDLEVLLDELHKILLFERSHPVKTNVYRILPWIRHYLETAAGQGGNWFFDNVLQKFYCREIYAIVDISFYGDIQPCGLAPAKISIHENRERGLLALWEEATAEIRKTWNKAGTGPIATAVATISAGI
jgi:MoaA/NifB/PqqE/SkfB family radical SAM enzyme